MANNCWYEMRAVSKSKESLERLIAIINYLQYKTEGLPLTFHQSGLQG